MSTMYAIRRETDGLWYEGCGYGGAGNPVPYFTAELKQAKLYKSKFGMIQAQRRYDWMKKEQLRAWVIEADPEARTLRELGPVVPVEDSMQHFRAERIRWALTRAELRDPEGWGYDGPPDWPDSGPEPAHDGHGKEEAADE